MRLRSVDRPAQVLGNAHAGSRIFTRDDKGAAAVEFAIIFPVLVGLMLGILAYGIYLGAVHSTAQLAADAARASVAGLTDAERTAIALQQITSSARSYPLIDRTGLVASAAPLEGDPTSFQVTVAYDARTLPIWNFAPFLPLPSKTISRSAVVKRGGY